MSLLIVLLIAGLAIAVVTAFVRGLMAFHRDAERIRKDPTEPVGIVGLQQNRMMALMLLVLLGAVAGRD